MQFENGKIIGIQLILPSNEIEFEDEIDNYNFTIEQSHKLKKVMGYGKRRVVPDNITSADLLVYGFNKLVKDNKLNLDSIDALIVVTQTPDYLIPGTSYLVHGQLGMKKDMLCLDINQGCAGFIVGLNTALSLLSSKNFKRIALANVDIMSKLVSKEDRNSRPIIGDAAAITIIDSDSSCDTIQGNLKVDGSCWDALMIPAGGMKLKISDETSVMTTDPSGNSALPLTRQVKVRDNFISAVEEIKSGDVKLYPVPTNGLMTIELNDKEHIKSLKVFDMLGKEISDVKVNVNGSKAEIDMQGKAAGIYILNVETETATHTKKFNLAK
jgi:3-oxoacyl-[acyl-carrier-protein] synthase III